MELMTTQGRAEHTRKGFGPQKRVEVEKEEELTISDIK